MRIQYIQIFDLVKVKDFMSLTTFLVHIFDLFSITSAEHFFICAPYLVNKSNLIMHLKRDFRWYKRLSGGIRPGHMSGYTALSLLYQPKQLKVFDKLSNSQFFEFLRENDQHGWKRWTTSIR